jgi:hypothetical protein
VNDVVDIGGFRNTNVRTSLTALRVAILYTSIFSSFDHLRKSHLHGVLAGKCYMTI